MFVNENCACIHTQFIDHLPTNVISPQMPKKVLQSCLYHDHVIMFSHIFCKMVGVHFVKNATQYKNRMKVDKNRKLFLQPFTLIKKEVKLDLKEITNAVFCILFEICINH